MEVEGLVAHSEGSEIRDFRAGNENTKERAYVNYTSAKQVFIFFILGFLVLSGPLTSHHLYIKLL